MAASADVIAFRLRSEMPGPDVDLLESSAAGYLDITIQGARARIYAQLRKRYDITFPSGDPEIVWRWIVKLVTPDAYLKRGCNPNDPTIALIVADRVAALAEIKEAADAESGLYDLPLLPAGGASAITRGGPMAYSEASPYTWAVVQAKAGRIEDGNAR